MKTKDIARVNGFNLAHFDAWVRQSGYQHKVGLTGGITLDVRVNKEELIAAYKDSVEQEQARFTEKQQALSQILITSGFNFDGYRITKYSGYISGDSAISVNRPTQGWLGVKGNVGDDMMEALVHIRREALVELKEAALALGCNAVIGVDFDYLTLDPETVTSNGGTLYLPFLFGVTANGNAVIIEKEGAAALNA